MQVEDDEDDWVPLEPPLQAAPTSSRSTTIISPTTPDMVVVPVALPTDTMPNDEDSSQSRTNPSSSSSSSTLRYTRIRRRRRRSSSQEIPAPISSSFASSFSSHSSTPMLLMNPWTHLASHLGRHLFQQIWCLEGRLHLSMVCGSVGMLCQVVYSTCWSLLYPEAVWQMCLLVVAAMVPIAWFFVYGHQPAQSTPSSSSQDDLWPPWWKGGQLNAQQLRTLLALGWFVIPAWLELRTLYFLAGIVGSHPAALVVWWFVLALGMGIRYYYYYYYHRRRPLVLAPMTTLVPLQNQQGNTDDDNNNHDWRHLFSPRLCNQYALYALYGIALAVVLWHPQGGKRHVPALAAHFLTATAVLLYKSTLSSSTEQGVSHSIHQALRGTVRDVLQELGTSVRQDELFQLTMLRWLVEYWNASGPSCPDTASSSSNGTSSNRRPSSEHGYYRRQDLEWSELWSMLQATTQQMSVEVEELHHQQQEQQQQQPTTRQDTNVTMDRPEETTETTTNNATPSSTPSSPFPPQDASATSTATNGSNSNNNNSMPAPPNSSHRPHPASSSSSSNDDDNDDAIQHLQAMLISMKIDDEAKPAITAYKQAVQAFPPCHSHAVILGLVCRAPATILLCYYCVCVCVAMVMRLDWVAPINNHYIHIVIMVVAPFVLLEVWRIHRWMESCRQVAAREDYSRANAQNDHDEEDAWILKTVDPMTILLMDDDNDDDPRYNDPSSTTPTRLPTLLVVWHNVGASVTALEAGLTAARCVQTTAVAVDFATNMLSLINFGLEVSQHGWGHGVSVVAKELWHLHTTGTDVTKLFHGVTTPAGASYTSSLVSAVRNSQTMIRNVEALSEEQGIAGHHHLFVPVVEFLAVLIGQGWLWGRRGEDHESNQDGTGIRSTVTIVEVDDETDDVVASHQGKSSSSKRENTTDEVDPAQEDSSSSRESKSPAGEVALEPVSVVPDTTKVEVGPLSYTPGTVGPIEPLSPSSMEDTTGGRGADEDIEQEISTKFNDDTNEILDLLATCDEHGLIDPSEKNLILEQLAGFTEKKHLSSSLAWAFGTKLTLQGLVDHHNDSQSVSAGPAIDDEILVVTNSNVENSITTSNNVLEPSNERGISNNCLDLGTFGVLSLSSDEGSSPESEPSHTQASSTENTPTTTSRETQDYNGLDDDDDDFEPLQPFSETEPILSSAANQEEIDTKDAGIAGQESEGDDNLWLKLGGGLAVVGGFLALASAQSHDERKTKKNSGDNQ